MELYVDIIIINAGLISSLTGLLICCMGTGLIFVKSESVLKIAGIMSLAAGEKTIRRLRSLVEPLDKTIPFGLLMLIIGIALMGLGGYLIKICF